MVNLPSATASGLFNIKHETGGETQINTGHNFGDGPTGVVIGPDGHFYVVDHGSDKVIHLHPGSGAQKEFLEADTWRRQLISPSSRAENYWWLI